MKTKKKKMATNHLNFKHLPQNFTFYALKLIRKKKKKKHFCQKNIAFKKNLSPQIHFNESQRNLNSSKWI